MLLRWAGRKRLSSMVLAATLGIAGCHQSSSTEVLMELPDNFTGSIHVQMGVPGAPPLKREGQRYTILVPPDGKVVTSTVVVGAEPKFANVETSRVWGYTPSISKTGDGVPVGGSIEFFVGTREQYESAQAKKHKSSLEPVPEALIRDHS